MTPARIQLSRKKGWRMPANTVKVDRSTMWGNPFRVGEDGVTTVPQAVRLFSKMLATKQRALKRHDQYFVFTRLRIQTSLRGKNLACWCKPGTPCHADVLLEIANGPPCPEIEMHQEDVHVDTDKTGG